MVMWPVLCFGVLCDGNVACVMFRCACVYMYMYEYMILACMCAYACIMHILCVCVMCVVEKVCMSVWAAHVR